MAKQARKAKFKVGQVVVVLHTARIPYREIESIHAGKLWGWDYYFTTGEREHESGLRPLTAKEARGHAK